MGVGEPLCQDMHTLMRWPDCSPCNRALHIFAWWRTNLGPALAPPIVARGSNVESINTFFKKPKLLEATEVSLYSERCHPKIKSRHVFLAAQTSADIARNPLGRGKWSCRELCLPTAQNAQLEQHPMPKRRLHQKWTLAVQVGQVDRLGPMIVWHAESLRHLLSGGLVYLLQLVAPRTLFFLFTLATQL